jgi:magnesium transporter
MSSLPYESHAGRPRSRRRSQKTGLPPGTLVLIGEQRTGPVALTLIAYQPAAVETRTLRSLDELPGLRDDRVHWLNVGGLYDLNVIEAIGKRFALHPLLLEDVVNTEQRPKVEAYGELLFVVVKMLYVDSGRDAVQAEQVSLVHGPQLVLSFQENGSDVFAPIRQRLDNPGGRLRNGGADYLLYAMLDAIVDNYFGVLEFLGERIGRLEDRVLGEPDPKVLKDIYALKRDMLFVRRAVWPLREVLSALQRADSRHITEATRTYLRDVYDHTVQAIDTIESMRDMLSGLLEVHLSNVNNRLSAVMKVLTIITTIFMPLTFIAGVYGMNFKHMPELEWAYGYPLVLGAMAAIGLLMVWLFRRKRWL